MLLDEKTRQLELQLQVYENGIASKISHSVAQKLVLSGEEITVKKTSLVLGEYISALESLRLDFYAIINILRRVEDLVSDEIVSIINGSISSFGGSQIKPKELLRADVIGYIGIRRLLSSYLMTKAQGLPLMDMESMGV